MSQLDDTTKQALRLAAVGALLHNLGKVNAKFLDKQINSDKASEDAKEYLYQHILGLIAPYVGKLPTDWQASYDASKLNASAVLDTQTVIALAHAFNLPKPLDDRTNYIIGDLIEYLGVKEKWYESDANGKYGIEHIFSGGSRLTHLINRAHRGASGGEKEDIATAQQPDASDLYLSTPFGYETAAPDIGNINNLLQQIEAAIQKHLASPADPLPLADVIADLRPLLSQAIADTQRPLNDVTVGDIGHTGMAFLLTQAAEWILTGRTIDHAELAQKEADNTLLWRVLTIHADSLRYLEEAASLADLRVRQKELQDAFQKVSQKLAETLLAVEIYADEQRRLFVFPNVDQAHSAYQTVVQEVIDDLNIDGLRLTIELSEPVTNHPKDKGGVYIGDEVLKQLQTTPPYDFAPDTIIAFWQKQAGQQQTQICTACNLRPQGYGAEQVDVYKNNPVYYQQKAEARNICCICMERRSGVAKKWTQGELNTTVWLDEVADSNGRLALVVGHWNLEYFSQSLVYPHSANSQSKAVWLHTIRFLNNPCPDGHAFRLNGQTYAWEGHQSTLSGERELASLRQTNLTIHAPSSMNIMLQDVAVSGPQLSLTVQEDLTSKFAVGSQVKCWGQDFRITDIHLLETVDNAGRQRILSGVVWDATCPFVVQGVTKVNGLEITSPGEGAKSESFARLRRIWQTTQTFWQTALDEPNRKGEPLIPDVPHRLQIIPANRDTLDLGHYHTYDLNLKDSVKLSVVWDPRRKLFITCDNLDYLSKPELLGAPVIDFLKGELTLEEPTGYGGQNKTWGKITIEKAQPLPGSSYTPAIPILAEPRTFLALVPADRALAVIDAIQTKYAREMGKVRNRLPLHLGIVYFQRRTPLRAALDAGRRILKYELGRLKDEIWTVQAVACLGRDDLPEALVKETKQFDSTVAVTLEQNGRSLTWHVPARMGDGQTDDNWYPYVFFRCDKDGHADPSQSPTPRSLTFKGCRPTSDGAVEECWLIHAAELREGDRVYFTPATFDFQWLDSAGQRFAIAYDAQGRRRDSLTRPYLLDDLDAIQQAWELIRGPKGLTSSQIYALRDLIETKRESWQPTAKNWNEDCQPQTGTFWRFCRDAVVTANWKEKPEADFDRLTGWAVSGLLTDVIQLYMGVMKKKPAQEERTNE